MQEVRPEGRPSRAPVLQALKLAIQRTPRCLNGGEFFFSVGIKILRFAQDDAFRFVVILSAAAFRLSEASGSYTFFQITVDTGARFMYNER